MIELDFTEVAVIRLLVPLLILRRPLPGILLAVFVDWLDWRILDLDRRPDDHDFYQVWDKLIDLYYQALAAYVVLRWDDRFVRNLGLALFGYRLVGVAIFAVASSQELLLLFPNLFDNFFVLFYLYRAISGVELAFTRRFDALLVLLAIAVPQLAREFFLHLIQDRPWDMIRLFPGPFASRQLDIFVWVGVYLLPQLAALRYVLRWTRLRLHQGLLWAR